MIKRNQHSEGSIIFQKCRNDRIFNFIKRKQTLLIQMLERFTESFNELKKSISLKYIDASLRQKCDEVLLAMNEDIPQSAEICRAYISKIQQVHESFLQSISSFIDSFPHYASDYQQQFQSIQHDLMSVNKSYQEEKRQWNVMMQDMNDKMQRTHKEIMIKQEDIRQLHLKLEERDSIIDQLEKQSNQYLKKVEFDLERQQKALEESYFVVQRLQEQIELLKYQNEKLRQSKNTIHVVAAYSPQQVQGEAQEIVINRSYIEDTSRSNTLVRCSMGSQASHEGLSQFEEIQQNEDSREVMDSMDYHQLPRCETLKNMLNMSVEKEYKLQYIKCDSIQNKNSKENFKPMDLRDQGSKENNEGWMVNNSLEFICKQNKQPISVIKQFRLVSQPKEDNRENNPYYFYFLIATQNAKINSQHFEQICSLSAQSQWQALNHSKTPLHEWQRHIQTSLLKQANII